MGNGFSRNRRFDNSSDSFQTSSSRKFSLAVVLLLIGLFDILIEQFEEEFPQMLDQFICEGRYLTGEILNDTLEGIDNILQIVMLEQLEIDSQDILEKWTNQVFRSLVLENAVES